MSTKATILFVDDEERIVNVMRIMFRNDYEVFTATSGEAALEIIRKHRVHVIVSDQRMPGMVGTQLLSQVKELAPGTMRILLTGYSDLAAIVGSINEGEVYRFINKPWNNDDLRNTVKEAAEIALQTEQAIDRARSGAPVAAVPSAAVGKSGLLVIDDGEGERKWFQEHFGGTYPVYVASSMQEAISILEQRDVGVIVTDANVGGENTLQLLRILKQQYPMIMTVMLTTAADSEHVIKLINEAQVCRVAFKPMKQGPVDLALKAAMKQHQSYRSDPSLAARQKVAKSSEPENAQLKQSIVSRLRSLGSRFGLFAHS